MKKRKSWILPCECCEVRPSKVEVLVGFENRIEVCFDCYEIHYLKNDSLIPKVRRKKSRDLVDEMSRVVDKMDRMIV